MSSLRNAHIKCIRHSSGVEMPLLCYDKNDNTGIEYILPAMPLVRGNAMLSFLMNESDPEKIDKLLLDIVFRFGNDSLINHYSSLFIQEGTLSLIDKTSGEILLSEKYTGIYPSVRIKKTLLIGNDITDDLSWLVVKCSFRFLHPDDSSKKVGYAFTMPFLDILLFAEVLQQQSLKRYQLDTTEMKYVEIVKPAASKSLPRAVTQTQLLQKGDKQVNPQAQMLMMQSSSPSNKIATAIASSRLTAVNKIQTGFILADLGILLNSKPDLPLQPSIANGVFKDWKKDKTIWCQDELTVALPTEGTPFTNSPFQFLFRVKGMDTQGRPVLESEITIMIQSRQNSLAANYAGYTVKRIPRNSLAISISVPYTDNNGKTLFSSIASSSTEVSGDMVIAKFMLNNEWSRVAYAALSSDNVISENIKLKVSYLYQAYSKVTPFNLSLVSLNKIDKLQVLKTLPRAFKPVSNVFIASQNTLINTAGASVKYDAFKPATNVVMPLQIALPLATNIVPAPEEKVEYKTDSLLYNNELELSFPCTEYGEYYQEEKNTERTMIGCREPYKLGEVTLQLYTELSSLSTTDYKLLRSTQVPNRFVIVPSRYVLSKNMSDDARPFDPALIVYSTFDVNNPMQSHAVINAILQPDIPYYKYVSIKEQLKAYTAYEPELIFLMGTGATADFRWTLPPSLYDTLETTIIGDLAGFSLKTAISNALTVVNMLKPGGSGITGSVRFSLPDGMSYNSSVVINIEEAEGPWMNSPLIIERADDVLTLKNIAQTTIDVAGYYYRNEATLVFQNLNISLLKNQQHVLSIAEDIAIVPQYAVQQHSGTIAEVHSYLEDIICQILFINTSSKDISMYSEILIQYSLETDINFIASPFVPADAPLEVYIPMPLTTYLSQRNVRYKLKATMHADNAMKESNWYPVSLAGGNIIDLAGAINLYL